MNMTDIEEIPQLKNTKSGKNNRLKKKSKFVKIKLKRKGGIFMDGSMRLIQKLV